MIARRKPSVPDRQPIAYGCCRVSTDRQAESKLSLDSQDVIIRDYFARCVEPLGATLSEISIDSISAYKNKFASRPEAGRIYRKLERGDHLIVAKHDRMFRNMLDLALTYDDLVEQRGVVLHVINLNFDSSKPDSLIFGKLVLNMFTSIAEYESAMNAQRKRDANTIARLQGRHVAGVPPHGWKVVGPPGKRTLAPDEEARSTMRWIMAQRDAGHSFVAICDALKKKCNMRRVYDKNAPQKFRLEPWRPDKVERVYWRMREIVEKEAQVAAEKEGKDA
jgi:DNA invertase Pin-like site-specific DNA recombinase